MGFKSDQQPAVTSEERRSVVGVQTGEWPTDYESLRAAALVSTRPVLSRRLLEKMPRLVAHRTMSGLPGLAYTDFDIGGAICCTDGEGVLLYYLASLANPLRPLEIGCYVGWSTAHLLAGLHSTLQIVDPFSEVSKELAKVALSAEADAGARFTTNMERCRLTHYVLTCTPSPESLSRFAPAAGWDFVFLDGEHNQGQPLRDIEGLLPHLAQEAVLALHDGWHPGVYEAIRRLQLRGMHTVTLPTTNLLTIAWSEGYFGQCPRWWPEFESMANHAPDLMAQGAAERIAELRL